MPEHSHFVNLIWRIATDYLRDNYTQSQYERVILPLIALRRFDCVLADTKALVLAEYTKRIESGFKDDALDRILNRVAGQRFHNHSPLDFQKLKGDPEHIERHLVSYIQGFSANVRRIFDFFEFELEIRRMSQAKILYFIIIVFEDVDLHPNTIPNDQMGLIFEDLIRRFNEQDSKNHGEYFTPREVIRLMVNLLFINDSDLLTKPGISRTLLDPVCGTGGMLAEAQNYLRNINRNAKLHVFGQDYNRHAFATTTANMLIKNDDLDYATDNIRFGDIFTEDQFKDPPNHQFDYFLANPPFGINWKKNQYTIKDEQMALGFKGRFGAGTPRINDSSLLFVQHMLHKFQRFEPDQGKMGSRMAVILSGSPLFVGNAGSGESDIRRWIIYNDWLESIVALPEQMFYNTGMGTYIWILTNRKEKHRKGKVQLIDARDLWVPMRRSLGAKRRKFDESTEGKPNQIDEIIKLYGTFQEGPRSKIFNNDDFGYIRVTVERPLRLRYHMTFERKERFLNAAPHLISDLQTIDKTLGNEPLLDWNNTWARIQRLLNKFSSQWTVPECTTFRSVFTSTDPQAQPVKADQSEGFEPDPALRYIENIPLTSNINDYFKIEVLPHISDAWMDRDKDRVGFEINFNRYFYTYTPPRPLHEIDADLKRAEEEILRLLRKVTT